MRTELELQRPLTLVFARHGESEANLVQKADKEGDTSGFTEDFRNKPNSEMRLTEKGQWQAEMAGKWIRANIQYGYFEGYYVSSYKRAQQTAGYLHLPQGEILQIWVTKDYLREQDWGHLDNMPDAERFEKFPEIMAGRDKNKFYWPGVGGESMANLIFRTKVGIISTMHRELPGKTGIAVSHGNTLWAVRSVMESLTVEQFRDLDSSKNPLDRMNNCQILQYTRVDPEDPSHIEEKFKWMRTVCPWDLSLSRNEWQIINRPKFSNAQLLAD